MRRLNEREREIIRAIANIPEDCKGDFSEFLKEHLFTIKNSMAILVSPEENMAVLYVEKQFYPGFYKLLEFLSLMEYLKAERYLIYVSLTKSQTTGRTFIHQGVPTKYPSSNDKVILNRNGNYLLMSDASKVFNAKGEKIIEGFKIGKSESNLYAMILEHLFGLVYPTEELKQFVKNDFKTKEDLNFRKTINIAWWGIGVAIGLGLVSIAVTILVSLR